MLLPMIVLERLPNVAVLFIRPGQKVAPVIALAATGLGLMAVALNLKPIAEQSAPPGILDLAVVAALRAANPIVNGSPLPPVIKKPMVQIVEVVVNVALEIVL